MTIVTIPYNTKQYKNDNTSFSIKGTSCTTGLKQRHIMYSISRAGWACIQKLNAGTGTNQKLNCQASKYVGCFFSMWTPSCGFSRSIAKTRSTLVWDVMIPSFLVACLAGWIFFRNFPPMEFDGGRPSASTTLDMLPSPSATNRRQ